LHGAVCDGRCRRGVVGLSVGSGISPRQGRGRCAAAVRRTRATTMEAMRTARMTRVARGSAAATLATFVALLSHVAAGGAMPGWLGVAAPWMFSILVCVPLAGRRLSVLRVTAAVVVSQALFHVLFVLGSGS